MEIQYFCAYQQGVVSSTSPFIIYPLSSFYFPSNFAPNFPFLPPPPPPTEYNAPSDWVGIKKITTASTPD